MTLDEHGPFAVSDAIVITSPGVRGHDSLFVSDGRFRSRPTTDSSPVIEAAGAYAVPLMVESAVASRPSPERHVYDLIPGNPATFALVRRAVEEWEIRRMLVIRPGDLAAVFVSGHAEARNGRPTRAAGMDVADPDVREKWVGTWEDRTQALEQHLLADGRYSETRNGRAGAFTGRYWVRENRITYLDDSGFWAFGEQLEGTLHHAGFMMTRRR